MHTMSTEI